MFIVISVLTLYLKLMIDWCFMTYCQCFLHKEIDDSYWEVTSLDLFLTQTFPPSESQPQTNVREIPRNIAKRDFHVMKNKEIRKNEHLLFNIYICVVHSICI